MTDRQKDALSVVGVGMLMFIAYAFAAPASLCGADNGEFVTLSVQPGVAHPPGYPLYTLYLRAMSWLPGATIAHSAAVATALLGAAAIAVLAFAGIRWGCDRRAAAIGAMLVGVELHIFEAHSHAEVFALNNLIAAAILCTAAPNARRPVFTAVTLGLLAGLGLSNHHSIVLLAPIGLYGLWCAVRAAEKRALALGLAVLAGVAGLSPYLTLLFSTECLDCISWGRFDSMADLAHHILRGDYGTTSLGVRGERAPLTHLWAFGKAVGVGSWGVLLLATAGGFVRFGRDGHKRVGLALFATLLLCGPVFVMLFNNSPEGIGADITARFYALPIIVMAIPTIFLLDALDRRILLLAAALVIVGCFHNGREAGRQCTGVLDGYARDILTTVPPDAILFGTGDHRTFGTGYMQYANGVRPDVDWVDARMLAHEWYVARLERRLGTQLPRSTTTEIPLSDFIATVQAIGRPVFVTHIFADVLRTLPSYPLGPVIGLIAPGDPAVSPAQLAQRNAQLTDRLTVTRRVEVWNPWEEEVFQHYARPWRTLEQAFRQIGDERSAFEAEKVARQFD